jgi:hypothetical protein
MGHLALRQFAWHIFSENPLWGVGLGSLSSVYAGTPVAYSSVHNVPLLHLAESGIVGGLGLTVLLVTLYRLAPLPIFVSCLVGWNLYLDLQRLPYVWVVLGILIAFTSEAETDTLRRDLARGPVGRRLISGTDSVA